MPFESESQRKFLYARHPKVAAKFAEHDTPKYRKLPKHKKEAIRRRLMKQHGNE